MKRQTLTAQAIHDSIKNTMAQALFYSAALTAGYTAIQAGFYFRDQSFVSTRVETFANMQTLQRLCKGVEGCKGLSFSPDYTWASPSNSVFFKFGAHLNVGVVASNAQIGPVIGALDTALSPSQKSFVFFNAPNSPKFKGGEK
jgi:hypothetical protein